MSIHYNDDHRIECHSEFEQMEIEYFIPPEEDVWEEVCTYVYVLYCRYDVYCYLSKLMIYFDTLSFD